MPGKQGDKYERQYQHVLDSEREQGRPKDRAKEIAARTVNQQRRKEGQTPNKRTMGTGNPNTPLEDRLRDELYNRARELGISGRSSMTKAQLVAAIRSQS